MRYQISLLIVILVMSACKEAIEVVEIHNENGQITEKFEMRKHDNIRHGFHETYDTLGNLIGKKSYQNGKIQGKAYFYYDNGQVYEEENYENGLIVGEVRSYYKTGEIQVKKPYIIRDSSSVLEGTFYSYYKNGNVKVEATMVDSEENGPFIEYYENGKIQAKGSRKEDPKFGPRDHGLLELYDKEGKLIKKMDCEMGRCSTIFQVDTTANQ